MKSIKNFTAIFALALVVAQTAFASGTGDDTLVIGKKGSVANKTVKMGAGRVVWNQSSSKLTFSNDSGASFKNLGSGGGGGGGINLLQDFNFDFEGGTASWTASGGSFTAATSGSNLIFDVQSGVFNSSAASQTLSSTNVAVPEGFKGAPGAAGCYFKTTASDYKVQVFDGSVVIAERTIPVISAAPQKIAVSFIFPSNGSVRLRVISASDAADLAIDNCFLGEQSTIQIAESSVIGSAYYPNTASCGWALTTTGATAVAFSASAPCPAPVVESNAGPGVIQAVDNDLPQFTVNDLPPGNYLVRMYVAAFAGSAQTSQLAINDGVTTKGSITMDLTTGATVVPLEAEFDYTVAGSHTFKLFGSVGAANTLSIFNSSAALTASAGLRFVLEKLPGSTQQALAPDTVAMSWSGYHANNCTWSNSSVGAFADVSGADSSCTFVEKSNRNFGTVTSMNDGTPGNNLPGIVFNAPRVGTYEVCASVFLDTNPEAQNYAYARLVDTSGYVVVESSERTSGVTVNIPYRKLCGLYPVTSVGSKTLKVQIGGGAGAQIIAGDTVQRGDIEWTIFAIDQAIPAPVFVGAVVSSSPGVEVVNRLSFAGPGSMLAPTGCSSDPCTIYSQSGSWVSAVNRTGTGTYDVHYSGFSGIPVCTPVAFSGGASYQCNVQAMTSSVLTLDCSTTNTGANTDMGANVICMGTK